MKINIRPIKSFICLCFLIATNSGLSGQIDEGVKIKFVDYFIENASPLTWNMENDSTVRISVLYDYERESVNRQATHWYFRMYADPGTHIRLILPYRENIYNGQPSWDNPQIHLSSVISYDGKNWEGLLSSEFPGKGKDQVIEFTMKEPAVFIARMPPYTISDLENLKTRIAKNPLVNITYIGKTVEERPLEIIRIGNPDAPNTILIRARAHPWEAGGNWVVEGLIRKFLSQGNDSKKWLDKYCVYIMPMANKDGVARGMTRYNVLGRDLNRRTGEELDSIYCPEKFVQKKFTEKLIAEGKKPALYIDIHNDSNGSIGGNQQYKDNIQLFKDLMKEYTAFSEKPGRRLVEKVNPANLIKNETVSMTYELNASWLDSLKKIPDNNDWITIGENMNEVFYKYFSALDK